MKAIGYSDILAVSLSPFLDMSALLLKSGLEVTQDILDSFSRMTSRVNSKSMM